MTYLCFEIKKNKSNESRIGWVNFNAYKGSPLNIKWTKSSEKTQPDYSSYISISIKLSKNWKNNKNNKIRIVGWVNFNA